MTIENACARALLARSDRFLARHAAFIYYYILCTFYLFSPKLAYNFSELIESHAVDTYSQFQAENQELLRQMPPPAEAIRYYEGQDMYLFDEFQTSVPAASRRPVLESLYDVSF